MGGDGGTVESGAGRYGASMRRSALPVAVLLAAPLPAQDHPAAGPDLPAELAALVDLPTAKARQAAAIALARRPDTTLEQWRAAMATFGTFAAIAPGSHRFDAAVTVGDAAATIEVFVLVPDGHDPTKPSPLLFHGHGSGGNGRELAMWADFARQSGSLVVCPTEDGPNAGYGFTPRERQAALAVLRWARRTFNVDENRIAVTGVSRGGHLTWDLILRHPDHWCAAAPMIGGPRLALGQNNLRYLDNVLRLPIRDLQGSHDDPLLLANLRSAFARLQQQGARDAKLVEFAELGHSFELGAVDWPQFFGNRREPLPDRIVRRAARLDEARSAWVEILAFERTVAEDFPPRVDARKWDALDEQGRREHLADLALERTARLEISRMDATFTVATEGVRRLRLLLEPAMIGSDGAVTVHWGRARRLKPVPDKAVLLGEFAERFDRTFLPVAEITVNR